MKQITFRIVPHTARHAVVVEVFMDGVFRAAIYPEYDRGGIRVMSTHLAGEPVQLLDAGWQFLFEED